VRKGHPQGTYTSPPADHADGRRLVPADVNVLISPARSQEPSSYREQGAAALAAGPLRLHVDLCPAGAGQRGDEGWRVLADPESNEFCLLRRPLAPDYA